MTRSDLVEKLAVEKNITIVVAEKIIMEIFKSMADALISGGRVEIRGLGSFEVREYAARAARNPKSGEAISVAPTKRPFFKTGKELKERIEDSGK